MSPYQSKYNRQNEVIMSQSINTSKSYTNATSKQLANLIAHDIHGTYNSIITSHYLKNIVLGYVNFAST